MAVLFLMAGGLGFMAFIAYVQKYHWLPERARSAEIRKEAMGKRC